MHKLEFKYTFTQHSHQFDTEAFVGVLAESEQEYFDSVLISSPLRKIAIEHISIEFDEHLNMHIKKGVTQPPNPSTIPPTNMPVSPTDAPTNAPVPPPTFPPTNAPVPPPTEAPTNAPVQTNPPIPPTESPSNAPVTDPPTNAPIPPTVTPTQTTMPPTTISPNTAPPTTEPPTTFPPTTEPPSLPPFTPTTSPTLEPFENVTTITNEVIVLDEPSLVEGGIEAHGASITITVSQTVRGNVSLANTSLILMDTITIVGDFIFDNSSELVIQEGSSVTIYGCAYIAGKLTANVAVTNETIDLMTYQCSTGSFDVIDIQVSGSTNEECEEDISRAVQDDSGIHVAVA